LRVIIYKDDHQFSPFLFWLTALQDKVIKERIMARIDRIDEGNFGDHKYIDAGVWELRMTFGGGIRIYYGIHQTQVVLLLNGGNKSSQQLDIKKAIRLWQAYLETIK
jgi:putative addiction module killer protein